jgi:formylglycine-generating enzyme required for sulfatase activity
MRYCGNCGKHIAENARFCTYCGTKTEQNDEVTPPPEPLPENPETIREFSHDDVSDPAYKILESGRLFCGYTVIRLLNKDPEGIKYIAEKDSKKFVLKLFFKYKFSNLDTIMGLQMRLKRLNKLEHSRTAKVVEINQHNDPPYMVSEFTAGESLAQIKNNDPDRLTEQYVREIARQLIETSMSVRHQGLSLVNLSLVGIMVKEDGEITVLSSGIKYEEVEEREEVFNIGVLLAQLLCRNVLYKTIYNTERLREQKFAYISGTTYSMNKLLGECLHRNMMQRYVSLETLLKNLKALPPVEEDDEFLAQGAMPKLSDLQELEAPKPKARIEWPFWIIVGLIIIGVISLFTYFMPKLINSGALGSQLAQYFGNKADTTKTQLMDNPPPRDNGKPGTITAVPGATRDDPRLKGLPPTSDFSQQKPAVKTKIPVPANFVHIPDGSIGFVRLKENPNDNVSLDDFYISKTEVTQSEWSKYMMPAEVSFSGNNLPVDNISWMNIIRYCNARSEDEGLELAYKITGSTAKSVTCNFSANGYRLPTEAEWEMAAKGGALNAYSGSDNPDDVAWYRDNSGGRYRSGGGKQANGFGVYDMSGNVAEWCWDWYEAKYPTLLTTFINPSGPETGLNKIIRGGSVRNGIGTNLGILFRDKGDPSRGYQYIGFRLVRRR